MVHLQILKIRIIQTLIDIIVNLLPYYFTKFNYFRRLIYQSTSKYNPINLDSLSDDNIDDIYDSNIYDYYENTHL